MKHTIHCIIRKGIKGVDSKFTFYITLFLSAGLILALPIYPSVDGAAHLYNSAIIKDLIFNASSPFHSYFRFNPVIVPNWLDHIFLALLMVIFPAIWAQKLFVIAIIVSLALVFRKTIILINSENKVLSCLIFPFIFSCFFYIGLYNQLLSFLILNGFILWLLSAKPKGNSYYLGLVCFSVLLWFSSIVIYALFLIFIGIFTLFEFYDKKPKPLICLKKIGFLWLLFLPTLVLSINFITKIKMLTDEKPIDLLNKFFLFFRLESLIIFDLSGESKFTIPIVILLAFLFLRGKKTKLINNSAIKTLQWCCVIVGLLFFIVPNNSGAGMLSHRLAITLYLLFIILICRYSYPKPMILWSTVLILGIHIGLMMKRHNGRLKSYSQSSIQYLEVGKHIPEGATVWPISFDDDWFLGHSNNYLGIPNSSIILENYETYYPWFPLLFRSNKAKPNILYNDLRIKNQLNSFSDIQADYLVVYAKKENHKISAKSLIARLDSLVFQTADSRMKLYKLKAY